MSNVSCLPGLQLSMLRGHCCHGQRITLPCGPPVNRDHLQWTTSCHRRPPPKFSPEVLNDVPSIVLVITCCGRPPATSDHLQTSLQRLSMMVPSFVQSSERRNIAASSVCCTRVLSKTKSDTQDPPPTQYYFFITMAKYKKMLNLTKTTGDLHLWFEEYTRHDLKKLFISNTFQIYNIIVN